MGGRNFGNYEGRLPAVNAEGVRIHYSEWDVHRYKQGQNRGPERLILGSDDKWYYTSDHYNTFIEIKPPHPAPNP